MNPVEPTSLRAQPMMRRLAELLGSMRFAISLLTLICVASAIGTLVRQNEPWVNYVNQFGPFWASWFQTLGVFSIYNAPWFVAVMTFLVVSTSLCVWRNAPKMIHEMKVYRENVRESSLKAFAHRWEGQFSQTPAELQRLVSEWIEHRGYSTRLNARDNGVMIAAKAGSANRLGYLATHLAIIVICIGGLLDSGVPLKLAVWATDKKPVTGAEVASGIPTDSRFGVANPSYRANLLLPEGETSRVAVLNVDQGLLIQDLPFELTLKQFRIDFYSTGMPKLFASDVQVHDPETGKRFDATIEVNKPLIYKGVTVYQSSFDDGGSRVALKGYSLKGDNPLAFDVKGVIGSATELRNRDAVYKLEFTGFKAFNVESMPVNNGSPSEGDNAEAGQSPGNNLNPETSAVGAERTSTMPNQFGAGSSMSVFQGNLASVVGPGVKHDPNNQFVNVGPSVNYKLRDSSGQAREFHNFMLPIAIDGGRFYLVGVRDTPAESFRYLRLPVDDQGGLDGFSRFRAALDDAGVRQSAAQRFATAAFGQSAGSADLVKGVAQGAKKALDRFAGVDSEGLSGLNAIAKMIETTVPEAERQKGTEVIIRLIQGAMWEVYQISRERAGLPKAEPDEVHGKFVQDAQVAYSDLSQFGSPLILQLDQFEEVKASVFQVAKAPGQWIVYVGCFLLVVGVFAMFYIRERRLFFWITELPSGAAIKMGMSTTRKTMDFEHEFEQICAELNRRKAAS